MTNFSKKYSDTSTRVLETLKVLFKGKASVQDILNHFEKIDSNNRIYTNEVILKYINTLKVFGFKFTKTKDKYVLLNSPCQFNFSVEDLEAINLIEKSSEFIPEEKMKEEIQKFLQEIEKGFSDSTKILANDISVPKFKDLDMNYDKYADRIKEFESFCHDNQKIKITYTDSKNAEVSITVEPKDIKYKQNYVYLSVYNPVSAQIQDINMDDVVEIRQLPLKTNPSKTLSSRTFKIKNRLAKAYTLHEGERVINIEKDGSLLIVNQNEDEKLLLKRLMRYGINCEVISPKRFREEMALMIDKTLHNYALIK